MRIARITLLVVACAGLAGCASVPLAPSALDARAKTFTPDAGRANVYVNRGGGLGTALLFQTVLDGRIVGSLAPNTFQWLSVTPGEHSVTMTGAENSAQQKLTAEAGRNYYYDVSVHMGWVSGRVHIEALSEEAGRKAVLDSKLAETTSYTTSYP